jgi:hypothetical protein
MPFVLGLLLTFSTLAADGEAFKPSAWQFDPNSLQLKAGGILARLRPLGDMHGLVIDKLPDAPLPVVQGRAFLNLEHYLETGRNAEYLPRQLDQTACLNRDFLRIQFPEAKDWPVASRLTYRFGTPGAVDAELAFAFAGEFSQFEVYFTSYFDSQYEHVIKVKDRWVTLELNTREQLLVPRDDKVASRYKDGRWSFLKDRIRLAEERFSIPVLISRHKKSGWTFAQMVEPGACTHIAPNRFANGHNLIIGGWDVEAGEKRSARIRMLMGPALTEADVEKAYEQFADQCRKARTAERDSAEAKKESQASQ